MVSGPLSPATWTRIQVRAAELVRPESTQKPASHESATAPGDTRRLENAGLLAAVGKTFSESRTEQTQTADAVSRRRQASLRPLVPEGEEDGPVVLQRAPPRESRERGGLDDFSGSGSGETPSYVLGADGRLYAVGGQAPGRDAAGAGDLGANEGPQTDPRRSDFPADGEASEAPNVLVGLPSASDLATAASRRAEAERILRARRQAGREADSGQASGAPRGESLFAPEASEEPFFARKKPEEPLFRPPKDEAFLGLKKKEKASLFEVEDVKPLFDRRERESLFDVSGGEPIFQSPTPADEAEPALIDDEETQELLDNDLQDRYKQLFTAFMGERSRS